MATAQDRAEPATELGPGDRHELDRLEQQLTAAGRAPRA
jgi:hypothetical protein